MMTKPIFLSAALALCTITATAQTFDNNGIVYDVRSSGEVFVVGYNADCPADVVIPEYVERAPGDSYNVKEIADNAFQNCTSMRTIKIYSGIVRIGSTNFVGCTSLEAINIDGTTGKYTSEDGVLYANRNINSDVQLVAVPAMKEGAYIMPSDVVSMWKGAFDSSNLSNVVLNGNISLIKSGIFKGCTKLKSLVFESMDSPEVQEQAFEGTSGFKAFVPRGAKDAYSGSFSTVIEYFETSDEMRYYIVGSKSHLLGYSRNLAEYSGSNNGIVCVADGVVVQSEGTEYPVDEVDDCALSYAPGMKHLVISPNLTRLGSYNFVGCTLLEDIVVVTTDGKYTSDNGALYANRNINSDVQLVVVPAKMEGTYIMPSDVVSMWKGAFANSCLTGVIFNGNITLVKDMTFKDAKNLKTVEFSNSTPPTFGNEVFAGCNGTITILVPKGSKSSYETATAHLNNVVVVEKNDNVSLVDAVTSDGPSSSKAYKTIENGRVVIIKNADKYDLLGRKIK